MSRVNGKEYEACIAELQAMRPPQEEKGNTGYWYYPIEAFTEAMDQVFGNEHYNLCYYDPIYRVIASGQEMVTVRCTLTIVDDDGRPVKRVDGFGDKELFYGKGSDRADVGNLTSSTAALAFKDACKYLGIFGYRTTAFKKQDKPAARKSEAKKEKGAKKEEAINIIVSDMFYQQGESHGQPIWKLPMKTKADQVPGEVVFYHNQTAKKAEKFNELFAFVESGLSGSKHLTLKLIATPSGEYNGIQQYVFKDFPEGR